MCSNIPMNCLDYYIVILTNARNGIQLQQPIVIDIPPNGGGFWKGLQNINRGTALLSTELRLAISPNPLA